MSHAPKAYRLLVTIAALLGTSAAFAQTWDPVLSDSMNNTAMGTGALTNPNLDADGGCHNTASGASTLTADTSGSYNSATGFGSLTSNLTGDNNTGLGAETLYSNTSGSNNTATGYQTLYLNTTGVQNSATGTESLYSNTTGDNNMAFGYRALYANSTGSYNTAVGTSALGHNLASGNSAQGYAALYFTTSGAHNTALGYFALSNNTTGSNNIGIGVNAGNNQTTGSNDVYIGNAGVAAESGIIRIGTAATQTATYVAGISGNVVTGGAVVVTSSGQLGVASSSRRYKEAIEPLGDVSGRLYDLRPVKFRYIKPDEQGQKPVQYGLVAEEVEQVLPEMVYRDADGKAEGVRYDELTPMLLSELQRQNQELGEMRQQLAEMRELNRAMQAALAEIRAKDSRVAIR